MTKVTIYTDGGAKGNPGPGGYGAVLLAGDKRREVNGGFKHTTNNRMELYAAIVAFESLKKPCEVDFYSDSKYLVDAFRKNWIGGWKKRGWKKSDKSAVMNADLWKRLVPLTEDHQVTWNWVKGHAGNKENERCDELVGWAIEAGNLPVDEGYVG